MSKKEYSERKARALSNKFDKARKTLDELERALSKVNIKEIHELNAYLDDVMLNSYDAEYYTASEYLAFEIKMRAKEIYRFLNAGEGVYQE